MSHKPYDPEAFARLREHFIDSAHERRSWIENDCCRGYPKDRCPAIVTTDDAAYWESIQAEIDALKPGEFISFYDGAGHEFMRSTGGVMSWHGIDGPEDG